MLALLLAIPLSGCVTKSQANEQARRAYFAGQQAEILHMQQQAQTSGQQPVIVNGGDISPQPFDPQSLGLSRPQEQPRQSSPLQPQDRSQWSPVQPQQMEVQPQTLSGQQSAPTQSVTIFGPVRLPVLPWRLGLTLGQALVDAGYTGATDPTELTVIRNGRSIRVDPQQLLSGQDVTLLPGDSVRIR